MKFEEHIRSKYFLSIIISISILVLIYKAWPTYIEVKTIQKSSGYLVLPKSDILNLAVRKSDQMITTIEQLQEGDILFRRKINFNTLIPSNIFPTYFTHVAYIGPNKTVFEAVGKMKRNADEIVAHDIAKSDWLDDQPENQTIFLLRPKLKIDQIHRISIELFRIAEDDSYHFGVRTEKFNDHENIHTLLCTSYVTDTLKNLKVIEDMPAIVSPDYMFKTLIEGQKFDVVEVVSLRL